MHLVALRCEQKKIRGPEKTPGSTRQRPERARKNPVRKEPRRDARRAVADARELSPLAELVHALSEEGIRFQIAGMSVKIISALNAKEAIPVEIICVNVGPGK